MTSSLRLLVAAIAAVAVVGGGVLWYVSQSAHPSPPTSTQAPNPSFASAPTAQPTPLQAPTASPEAALGWPTGGQNPPGVYSWDGNKCRLQFCGVSSSGGFMHNCYGPCDVAITIGVAPDNPLVAEATAVTIAGHSGSYRRVVEPEPSPIISSNGPLYEEWIVDIDGVVVAIRLYAEPGASEGGLGDAHAIIDSLRSAPSNRNAHGFALVFTLTTGDWDSG